MPSKHDHPQYGGRQAGTPNKLKPSLWPVGSALLAMLNERWPGFDPIHEMEKMYHDPETPPRLKKRLRKDLAAYGRVVAQDPSPVIDATDLL